MTRDQALGIDPTPVSASGGGLLAPSMLEQLFCDADLVGIVTDNSGMPLWMGRRVRDFTHAQWLALIARDGGCVDCGAHYSQCHAHHIVPWESPARGPTDIDNGVLLCSDCHHRTHEHERIHIRDPKTQTWSTRPAQPHEIAPKRRTGEPERPRLHERRRTGALW